MPSAIRRTLVRIVGLGVLAALLVAAGSALVERARLGRDDAALAARIEGDLRQRVAESAATLGTLARGVIAEQDLIRSASRDTSAVDRLFQLLGASVADEQTTSTGVTLYDNAGVPAAWVGRVSDMPKSRLDGPATLFIAADIVGPRLVRIEPIPDRTRPAAPRLGTVVAEELLGQAEGARQVSDTFVLSDLTVPVTLRIGSADDTEHAPYTFGISAPTGELLAEASVDPADLAADRQRWFDIRIALIAATLALTFVLAAAPVVEFRRCADTEGKYLAATAGLLANLALVRIVLWLALRPLIAESALEEPLNLLLNAVALGGIVWLALDLVVRQRLRRPAVLLEPGAAFAWTAGAFALAGAADGVLIIAYEFFLQGLVSRTPLDMLHLSLHPLGPERAATALGLSLLHAPIIWAGAFLLRLPDVIRRRPRSAASRTIAASTWIIGAGAAIAVSSRILGPVSYPPLLVAMAAVALCGAFLSLPGRPLRHASQAARFGLVLLALLIPALAMYPSLQTFATSTKEDLVANTFGPQAINQREDLQRQLEIALDQIDGMTDLPSIVSQPPGNDTGTDQAFDVWSNTSLGEGRLTSAVELYARNGELLSHFALRLPEYNVTPHTATGCAWVVFEEVSEFAASERHVLRASKDLCTSRGVLGSIVVRVMLDYSTLPFLTAQRLPFEPLRPEVESPAEGSPGTDVEFTFYGWGRAPIYTVANGVWPLSDETFSRMVASREPFWQQVTREDGTRYRVYFLNDRGGIYALGYPVVTPLGHLINLAELMFVVSVVWVLLLFCGTLFNALTSRTPASGRALLREVRSSFYRKLWLAIVASVVVPVVILSFAIRTYFANQFQAGVEQDALKTATVAQRLVEDYATLEQRGPNALDMLDDQIMVLVGQAIDQPVNLFDPKRLQATSERDLFASGLLTPRAPADVYRSLAISRLPAYVGLERSAGVTLPYLVAAAPVRASGREGIVTVPLTLRGQEADRQIDELDRGVLSGSVLFVLLGAGLGYWAAERIADPVSRLTRATRRIARGDLDARVAATSSDELRRLVEDFNRMAADLKRQRTELERTQRLEAWADMARQVAHDIKNPLTPIQLSAEHVQRVNQDRGRPLSPVLDECINSILGQVRLLRQISAEFSSFASSPTPRPEPTDLSALIEEVAAPYRTGLTGRIAIVVEARPGLPLITIDRTLFARALTNVVENALHAMPGGGMLTIRSAEVVVENRPAIVVTVADTGIGMDQEALNRIFEPYFSTKATGTGLGLTIAKRNVTLNGGTITVESRRNEGTTVTMTFPLPATDRRDGETS